MLYSNHIDGKYIQLQMGHKLESTSLNIYKHLDDDMLKEGIKLINNFKAK
jgi:integrase